MLTFEWDSRKAERNLREHEISFELAEHVFDDPDLLFRTDYSLHKGREQAIGMVGDAIILLVVHMVIYEDENQTRIRIISARVADARERRVYRAARA